MPPLSPLRSDRPVSPRTRGTDLALLAGVLLLPLAGATLAGRDLHRLGMFPPPLDVPVDYLRFSCWAEGAVAATLAAIVLSWGSVALRPEQAEPLIETGRAGRFPPWGWLAIAWTVAWWVLAWTRFPWFATWQRFTFFPLWLGFVVTVNACTERSAGVCLMRRRPARWLGLFAASAGFWWLFEWLNRFTENWHYLGVADYGAVAYALNASLCFSTVLPAVAAVAEWLASHPAWRRRLAAGPRWPWFGARPTGWLFLAGGGAALALAGVWPRSFYPALWAAPVALWLGGEIVSGRDGLAREVARGDWRRAATWMIAALICGFFWEMWNASSLARWIYTVPGVERWRVFEMPIAGYAGYLPFGLECLLIVERLLPAEWSPRRLAD